MLANNSSIELKDGKSTSEILELTYLFQVTFLTVFGNVMVIFAFIFGPRSIRTLTNYFLVNLSVSDLLVGFISIPFWIVFRIDSSLISDKLYHAVIPLDVLSGITSIICLAAISLERKLAVKYPCIHIHLTKKSVIVAILLTWVIGVIFSTAMYVVPKNLHSYRIFTAIIFTLGFIIPLCVIIESYCEIFYSSLNMMKSSNENVTAERELRVAKTISLVISLFIICWSPFFIVNMIYVFCHHCSRPKWPIYISKMLHYSNSMMNFFVYSTRSPEFRNFFKKIICPKKRRKSSQINIPLGELEKSRKISTMSTLSTISCQFDTSRAGLLRSARFSVGETPSISENRLSTIRDSFDELSNLFVIPT